MLLLCIYVGPCFSVFAVILRRVFSLVTQVSIVMIIG